MDKRTTERVARLLDKLNNRDLYILQDMVQREIRLSNQAIKEGFEK